MIFLRVLPKNFLWPHYSGAPGAWGPRFIEPPEPPVPTPLLSLLCTHARTHTHSRLMFNWPISPRLPRLRLEYHHVLQKKTL